MQQWPWQVHFTLAVAALAVNVWAFRLEYRAVAENAGILDAVLGEVDRVRAEKGLPPSDGAAEPTSPEPRRKPISKCSLISTVAPNRMR